MDIRDHINEYMKGGNMLHVATVKNNRPWIKTVWYVHDDDLNLYYVTRLTMRHAQETSRNPYVAGSIVRPDVTNIKQQTRGIQLEGTVHEVEAHSQQCQEVMHMYMKKYDITEQALRKRFEDMVEETRCFKLKPSKIIFYDEQNYPDSPRRTFVVQ